MVLLCSTTSSRLHPRRSNLRNNKMDAATSYSEEPDPSVRPDHYCGDLNFGPYEVLWMENDFFYRALFDSSTPIAEARQFFDDLEGGHEAEKQKLKRDKKVLKKGTHLLKARTALLKYTGKKSDGTLLNLKVFDSDVDADHLLHFADSFTDFNSFGTNEAVVTLAGRRRLQSNLMSKLAAAFDCANAACKGRVPVPRLETVTHTFFPAEAADIMAAVCNEAVKLNSHMGTGWCPSELVKGRSPLTGDDGDLSDNIVDDPSATEFAFYMGRSAEQRARRKEMRKQQNYGSATSSKKFLGAGALSALQTASKAAAGMARNLGVATPGELVGGDEVVQPEFTNPEGHQYALTRVDYIRVAIDVVMTKVFLDASPKMNPVRAELLSRSLQYIVSNDAEVVIKAMALHGGEDRARELEVNAPPLTLPHFLQLARDALTRGAFAVHSVVTKHDRPGVFCTQRCDTLEEAVAAYREHAQAGHRTRGGHHAGRMLCEGYKVRHSEHAAESRGLRRHAFLAAYDRWWQIVPVESSYTGPRVDFSLFDIWNKMTRERGVEACRDKYSGNGFNGDGDGSGSGNGEAEENENDAVGDENFGGGDPCWHVGSPVALTAAQLHQLRDIIDHFKSGRRLHFRYTMQILERVRTHYASRPACLRIEVPADTTVNIVGDLRGQLQDILTVITCKQPPGPRNWYVFNGNLTGETVLGVETVLLACVLKLHYPRAVHILRGGNETRRVAAELGFEEEVRYKYDEAAAGYPGRAGEVSALFQSLFDALPLCCELLFTPDEVETRAAYSMACKVARSLMCRFDEAEERLEGYMEASSDDDGDLTNDRVQTKGGIRREAQAAYRVFLRKKRGARSGTSRTERVATRRVHSAQNSAAEAKALEQMRSEELNAFEHDPEFFSDPAYHALRKAEHEMQCAARALRYGFGDLEEAEWRGLSRSAWAAAKASDADADPEGQPFWQEQGCHEANHPAPCYKVFVVHGGLFERYSVTAAEIDELPRFSEPPFRAISQTDRLMQQILWSQPCDESGAAPTPSELGVLFGPDKTIDFCRKNGVELVVRSRDENPNPADPTSGYGCAHEDRLLTVFSASRFGGDQAKKGAVVSLELPGPNEGVWFYRYPELDRAGGKDGTVLDAEKGAGESKGAGPYGDQFGGTGRSSAGTDTSIPLSSDTKYVVLGPYSNANMKAKVRLLGADTVYKVLPANLQISRYRTHGFRTVNDARELDSMFSSTRLSVEVKQFFAHSLAAFDTQALWRQAPHHRFSTAVSRQSRRSTVDAGRRRSSVSGLDARKKWKAEWSKPLALLRNLPGSIGNGSKKGAEKKEEKGDESVAAEADPLRFLPAAAMAEVEVEGGESESEAAAVSGDEDDVSKPEPEAASAAAEKEGNEKKGSEKKGKKNKTKTTKKKKNKKLTGEKKDKSTRKSGAPAPDD